MDTITDLAKFQQLGSAQIHPVILSGGAGTRLWPLSRAAYPKQLLKLVSERSLLQETAARNLADVGFAPPVIVCNEDHRFLVADQLEDVGIKPQATILEPAARNTGPAIAAAALWLQARDPDALMLVQPSDHVIGTPAEFHRAVMRGLAAARLKVSTMACWESTVSSRSPLGTRLSASSIAARSTGTAASFS